MSDVVEQGKSMLSTIEYARAKGITQAYPDSSVAEVVGNLVAEVERMREHAASVRRAIESWRNSLPGDESTVTHLVEVVEDLLAAAEKAEMSNE